ncbi:hypothetical protein [Sphingomonas sp. R86520]|jgi:hypothetical protein|uniref:hypothetical protein n=1 Tax=Sphingomonas sp. R86520 TaxID=3093859 RepID=UPI0036D22F33
MHSEAQTIARLKSMVFLIEEALRIADEGNDALLGAKLSDCIDCVYAELAEIDGAPRIGLAALASD